MVFNVMNQQYILSILIQRYIYIIERLVLIIGQKVLAGLCPSISLRGNDSVFANSVLLVTL